MKNFVKKVTSKIPHTLILLGVILLPLATLVRPALAAAWMTSTIEDGLSPRTTSSAVDNSGNYLIAYSDSYLKLRKYNASSNTWTKSAIYTTHLGEYYPTIAVDSDNNYLVVFTDPTDSTLLFAKSTDGGLTWTVSTIDDTTAIVNASLDVDHSDNYIVAYIDSTNLTVKFARQLHGETTWTITDTTQATDSSLEIAVAADNSDSYIIAYTESTLGVYVMKFTKSTNGGAAWSAEQTVDPAGGNTGYYISMTVDSANNYLIAYQDYSNSFLKFAKLPNGETDWTIVTVEDQFACGYETSIVALTSNTYLISHMGYPVEYPGGNLEVAKTINGGTSWTKSNIETTEYTGYYSSMAAANSSNVFVFHPTDSSNPYTLRISKSTDSGDTWNTEILESKNAQTGWIPAISKDSNGNYLAVYLDNSVNSLRFAKSTDFGQTWTTSTIAGPEVSVVNMCLGVDRNNNYVIIYSDGAQLTMEKSTNGGSSWTPTAIGAGSSPSITFDSDNHYIVSYNQTSKIISLAISEDAGANWETQILVHSLGIGLESLRSSTVSVDSAGRLFVSFLHLGGATPNVYSAVADHAHESWTKTNVRTLTSGMAIMGRGIMSTIDKDGNYLIAFVNLGDSYLTLASSSDQGQTWTLRSPNVISEGISITTDSDGVVTINSKNLGLQVLRTSDLGQNWTTDTITGTSNIESDTYNTTDVNNNVLTVFYDGLVKGVRFSKYDVQAPSASVTPLPGNETTNTQPPIHGIATETDGTVETVQFQVDGTSGTWFVCTADDGAFDEKSEAFTCVPTTSLPSGQHSITIVTTDSNNNTTPLDEYYQYGFTVNSGLPDTGIPAIIGVLFGCIALLTIVPKRNLKLLFR